MSFFEIYSSTIGKPTESIGVWISGFGSGKSHLLKNIILYIIKSRIHSDLIGEFLFKKLDKKILN